MSIFYSKEKDGTLNVIVGGRVTRDTEYRETARGGKFRFSVQYGKGKYMNCEAWEDSPVGQTAGMLERDDVVAVMGTYRSHEYNGKTYENVEADMICTNAAVSMPVPMPSDTASATDKQAEPQFKELDDFDDDDLPF